MKTLTDYGFKINTIPRMQEFDNDREWTYHAYRKQQTKLTDY